MTLSTDGRSYLASSSSYRGDAQHHGPGLAVDGILSNRGTGFFHSSVNEDHPWLQVHIPTQPIIKAVILINGHDGVTGSKHQEKGGETLKNIEIRAGTNPLPPNHRGPITINTLCGTFVGPGQSGARYAITCSAPIVADYVTVQMMEEAGTLHLNEVLVEVVPVCLS